MRDGLEEEGEEEKAVVGLVKPGSPNVSRPEAHVPWQGGELLLLLLVSSFGACLCRAKRPVSHPTAVTQMIVARLAVKILRKEK